MRMSAVGPWPTTPARTRTGPVTGVLRSSADEWGRRNHTEDWGRHVAHSLPNATQMQHETGKAFAYQRPLAEHIKGLLRILIPPFPGSNPGAPANQRGLRREAFAAACKELHDVGQFQMVRELVAKR